MNVGGWGGRTPDQAFLCNSVWYTSYFITPLVLRAMVEVTQNTSAVFKSGFLKDAILKDCRGVNFNSCLFLWTRAIALVLKKCGVLYYYTPRVECTFSLGRVCVVTTRDICVSVSQSSSSSYLKKINARNIVTRRCRTCHTSAFSCEGACYIK